MTTQLDGAVVVGVDESVFNGQALRWAAEQAHLEGRPLTLVNASGPVSGALRDYGTNAVPGTSTNLRRHGEELLDRAGALVNQAAPGVEVGHLFEVTDPRTLLIELSGTAHLVVLGSRGRGPVRSHLLGSVGVAVVRHAACPVVVHRPGHPGRVTDGVTVALDATAESAPVLEFAFRHAALRRLPLRVIHYVYDVRSTLVGVPMTGDLSVTTQEHALAVSESLAGLREEYPDVHLSVTTEPGVPQEELGARSRRAALLVVGSHHQSLIGRLLTGSVSTEVLQRVHCPVAVVPVG
jgi:nucleotide-binding universal stress UspA family protein